MAWIESNQTLERDGRIFLLRKKLGWDKNQVIGFLHRFWWLVLEQAPNGDVSALTAELVSETLGMKPDVVESAFSAMCAGDVRLLERNKSGRLLVHDWPRLTGKYLRDSLWKRSPEKWAQMAELYACIEEPSPVCRQSPTEQGSDAGLSPIHNITRHNKTVPTTLCPKPPAPDTPKPKRTVSNEAVQLTERLMALMRENDPKAKLPENPAKWQEEADRLFRIDGRSLEEAQTVLDWCQHDNFWRGNILSMPKFREKYPQLKLQMERQHGSGACEPGNYAKPVPGKYAHLGKD